MPAARQPTDLFPDDEIKELFAPIAGEPHAAIAVSGGSDSLALLHLAYRCFRETGPRLTVLTVDHGLRAESAREASEVGVRAGALGFDHLILRWEGKKPATGIQAAAREARYRLMGDWCRENGVRFLLVGHTIDDQAETVLMRMRRGAGIEGLGGMARITRHGDLNIFRPLLAIPRLRLRAVLAAAGERWIDDPSNENERFERVRMRKALAAAGLEATAVALTASRIRRAWEGVLAVTGKFLEQAVRHHDEGFGEIPLPALAAEPEEIRIRALWSLVARYGDHGVTELSQVESLSRWLHMGEGQARTLGGCRIARRKMSLIFGREPGRISAAPVPIPKSGRLRWDDRFEITANAPCPGLAIVPAGLAGKIARCRDLPAFVQAGLPAVTMAGGLAVVPNLGLRTSAAPANLSITATFGPLQWF